MWECRHKGHKGTGKLVCIVSYRRLSLMTFVPVSQFHAYLPWVNTSRGLLHDYELSFQALIIKCAANNDNDVIRINAEVKLLAETVLEDHRKYSAGDRTALVGVHVRRTDYKNQLGSNIENIICIDVRVPQF